MRCAACDEPFDPDEDFGCGPCPSCGDGLCPDCALGGGGVCLACQVDLDDPLDPVEGFGAYLGRVSRTAAARARRGEVEAARRRARCARLGLPYREKPKQQYYTMGGPRCRYGHAYTPENTYWHPRTTWPDGRPPGGKDRRCIACEQRHKRRWKRKHDAAKKKEREAAAKAARAALRLEKRRWKKTPKPKGYG